MGLPKNLRYTEHVWVKVEGNTAVLGVTDYGLQQIKEIVFIDLPKKGQMLRKGESFTVLESVKWSGHINSPISGEVVEVNEGLFDEPERLNKDPHGSWICKVKISDPDELKCLMDSEAAEKWVKENLG
ncbi:MAG: glycine cleavage system protein H [Candidatus Altiarchaeota archaeon]|nr:glycine cleavage system protein H [Candidatus Altiarchaeota archaeon]